MSAREAWAAERLTGGVSPALLALCFWALGACDRSAPPRLVPSAQTAVKQAVTLAGGCAGAAEGDPCDDGDGCTQSDTCQSGICVGGSPITCPAGDLCHQAGTCDPGTGLCTNLPVADGTSCDDGNACTQADSCQAGTCVGGSPITCATENPCRLAGICDPADGTCSYPVLADGTSCDDGNACTQGDSCQAGTCTGSNPVACAATDGCHQAGSCDPATGVCLSPVQMDGTPCSDGNACTQIDSCQGGTCTGNSPVACTAADACHAPGLCDPATGTCSNPVVADGAACDDGNACTQSDQCQAGSCTGGRPVTCAASDGCHGAGNCDPASGACSTPVVADGTLCDDGNSCTIGDSCTAGQCAGNSGGACDPVTTMLAFRADGMIARKTVATPAGALLDIAYDSTPTGRFTAKTISPGSSPSRYYTYESQGRVRCVTGSATDACPAPGDETPRPGAENLATYAGDNRATFFRTSSAFPGGSLDSYSYGTASGHRVVTIESKPTACADGAPSCTGTIAYTYDEAGSRRTESDSRFPIPGNLPQREFTYGPDRRLRDLTVQVPDSGPGADCTAPTYHPKKRSFVHGAMGRLIQTDIVEGGVTGSDAYYHLPNGDVAYRISRPPGTPADHKITYKYITLDGERVAAIRDEWQGETRTDRQYMFVHNDHLGAPLLVTATPTLDGPGRTVWQADRDTWGTTHTSGPWNADEMPFEFPGQTRLAGSEVLVPVLAADGTCHTALARPAILDNWMREYDPYIGAYTALDPLNLWSGSINPYAYALYNPVGLVDPLGLFGIEDLPVLPDSLVDGAAGFGDTVTFNLTHWIRHHIHNNEVNPCSKAYRNGVYVGIAVQVLTPLGAEEAAVGGAAAAVEDAIIGVPSTLARAIPGEGPFPTLGPPGQADVFVTAAEDIAGLSPAQVAERLTVPQSSTFTIVEFPTPAEGLASPVLRSDPGFVGRGVTAGGAREFVLPNGPIPAGASVRVIK